MNDEIKEILKRFKKVNVNSLCPFEMEASDCKKILDYITNLQQENERKERLITQYGEGMCAYANRIDKAIEYIENDMPYLEEPDDDYENTHKMIEYDRSILLNILQNGSEDNGNN